VRKQERRPAHAETGNDIDKCGEKAAVLSLMQKHGQPAQKKENRYFHVT